MSDSSITLQVLNLVNDPMKIAIWFEIMKNESITAKELSKKIGLSGTKIYYHLNQLKEQSLIITEVHQIPRSNLLQTTYSINKQIFGEEETSTRADLRKDPLSLKEALLFRLYQTIITLNKQIVELQLMDEEQVKELAAKEEILVSKIALVQKEHLPSVLPKFKEFSSFLDQVRQDTPPSLNASLATHGVLVGILPLEEFGESND